jgi:hypothetical protein
MDLCDNPSRARRRAARAAAENHLVAIRKSPILKPTCSFGCRPLLGDRTWAGFKTRGFDNVGL